MSKPVLGFWHKTKRRCDYCHRPTDNVYVVREGPCTGIFCGKQHYQLARERMENEVNTRTEKDD